MFFEYRDYLITTFVLPILAVIVSIFVIVLIVYYCLFKIKIISMENILKLIFVIVVSACLFVPCCVSLANGGIYLLRERENDAEVITGTIESVCEPSKRVPTYKGDVQQTDKTVHGADIVIDGKEYLSGSCVGFKEGDCVSITYLPRSRFILSISTLDNECDQ